MSMGYIEWHEWQDLRVSRDNGCLEPESINNDLYAFTRMNAHQGFASYKVGCQIDAIGRRGQRCKKGRQGTESCHIFTESSNVAPDASD
jgi:hypothetical protein